MKRFYGRPTKAKLPVFCTSLRSFVRRHFDVATVNNYVVDADSRPSRCPPRGESNCRRAQRQPHKSCYARRPITAFTHTWQISVYDWLLCGISKQPRYRTSVTELSSDWAQNVDIVTCLCNSGENCISWLLTRPITNSEESGRAHKCAPFFLVGSHFRGHVNDDTSSIADTWLDSTTFERCG